MQQNREVIRVFLAPLPVSDLQVSEITPSSLELNWNYTDGCGPVTYIVTGGSSPKEEQIVSGTSAVISNLPCGDEITFTVVAVAADGTTEGEGKDLSVFTIPLAVSDLWASEITPSSLVLNWNYTDGCGPVTYIITGGSLPAKGQSVSGTSTVISDLPCGDEVTFTVVAVAADGTTEGEGKDLSVFTNPLAISDLWASEITPSSVVLNWNYTDGCGPVTYIVTGGSLPAKGQVVSGTSTLITDLPCGDEVTFTVVAVAADGTTQGEAKDFSVFTTPLPVSDLQVSEITPSSLVLSWNYTDSCGPVTYIITGGSSPAEEQIFSGTSTVISDLPCGDEVTFTVVAVAADGTTEGEGKDLSVFTISLIHLYVSFSFTEPATVSNLHATEITTTSVALSWTAPVGCDAVTYIVTGSSLPNEGWNVSETSTSTTGFKCGEQVSFTVVATAADGTTQGAPQSISLFTKPATVSNLHATEITTTSVALSWTAPVGCDAVTYIVTGSSLPNEGWNVSETSTSTTGFKCGEQVSFTVVATAADGTTQGAPQSISLFTKPATVSNLHATEITTTSVALSWTAPVGCDAVTYIVTGSSLPNEGWNVSETSTSTTGFKCGEQVSFTVVATAADGTTQGAPQSISLFTKPATVSNLHATEITTTSVALSWTAPVGCDAVTYIVTGSSLPNEGWNVSETSTSTTGFKCGEQVSFTVVATAADGTTQGAPQSISLFTKPATVSNLHATEITTTSVALSWTAPVGCDAVTYIVTGSSLPNEGWNVSETSTSTTGFKCGEQVSFTVVATAADGTTQGAPQSISLFTKPATVSNLHATEITTTSVGLSWTAPVGCDAVTYIVTGSSLPNEGWNVSETSTSTTGFKCGEQVSFTVVATAADGTTQGAPQSISLFTKPATVSNLHATEITTTSVALSWTAPVGCDAVTYIVTGSSLPNEGWNVSETSTSITGFKCGEQVSFTVVATAADGTTQGAPQSISLFTMMPEEQCYMDMHILDFKYEYRNAKDLL
ncbi:receptor-type tyrosine-protein phosphatase eta-like [Protopterus annectens]|uniref:receptor-type tyrosine-protein phosphatase eta-like n=1 Tax=Protopterus annectens TaxID=7888 RepID=UPI001CFB4319|nr:receptor-type tyrosine-protein phosphatase eta-like [Protopterus annectens]